MANKPVVNNHVKKNKRNFLKKIVGGKYFFTKIL